MKRFFLILFLVPVFLLTFLLVLIQTSPFQKHLQAKCLNYAKQQGITLQIEELSSSAPLEWSVKACNICWGDKNTLSMNHAKFRIAFLPLLRGRFTISSLQVSQASLCYLPPPTSNKSFPILPFHLSAKELSVQELTVIHPLTGRSIVLRCQGKLKMSPLLEETRVELFLTELAYGNYAKIQGSSSIKKGGFQINSTLHIPDSTLISSFFSLPLEMAGSASFQCIGPWPLHKEESLSLASFSVHAEVNKLLTPSYPLLNRKWNIQADIDLLSDDSIHIKNSSIDSDLLAFIGNASLSPQWSPTNGYAVLSFSDLSAIAPLLPFEIKGSIDARVNLTVDSFQLVTRSPSLSLHSSLPFFFSLETQAIKQGDQWNGELLLMANHAQLPCKGDISFSLKERAFTAENIHLQFADSCISGKGSGIFPFTSYEGTFFVQASDLKPLRALFPQSSLEGKFGGTIALQQQDQQLSSQIDILMKNIRYQTCSVDSARITASLCNLLSKPSGSLSIDSEQLLLPQGKLLSLNLSSEQIPDHEQHFTLSCQGTWGRDFSLLSDGNLYIDREGWYVHIEHCLGSLSSHRLFSQEITFGSRHSTRFLKSGSISLGDGSFSVTFEATPEDGFLQVGASHIPLSLFSFLHPELSFQGLVSCQASLSAPEGKPEGYLLATLDEVSLPTQAKGSFQIHCAPNYSQVHAHVQGINQEFIEWSATIPLTCNLYHLQLGIPPNQPLSSNLVFEGSVENLFSYVQGSSEDVQGWLSGHLLASGLSHAPHFQGLLSWEQGLYENYSSGINLQEISVNLLAKGTHFELTNTQALDKQGGSIVLTGEMNLDPDRALPLSFSLSANLDQLHIFSSNSLQMQASGSLSLQGNESGAITRGSLVVNEATFTLSDAILLDIPTLPVVFINQPIHLQRISPPSSSFPIHLDIHLSATNQAYIQGKGLQSEWEGDLHMLGTASHRQWEGSLSLQKGEYTFAGKSFTLTKGDLFFFEDPNQEASLTITGELQLQDATLLVYLQGPLSNPRVTFQSIPALPTSSILSLILFDKEISEISPFQAVQLAQVIVSLSGGGPNVLEAIRKTIGVDRLSIAGKEGTDEVALQIGWYLTRGVTVSLSQSVTSSDITIEVDLKNGFVFEAQTQNQEEGKFSLKWNKRY